MTKLPEGAGKFFRTIVLAGGSLALACGGVAQQQGDDESTADDGSDPDDGSSGGSGSSSSGGTNGDGDLVMGSGGVLILGTGGGPETGVGGTPTIEPGPFDCPPEQWDCSDVGVDCSYGQRTPIANVISYLLPRGCGCDTSRPLEADDCPDGQVRTCLEASIDSEGNLLTEAVLFACECVLDTGSDDCFDACYSRDAASWGSCQRLDEEIIEDVVCGCELPVLR